MQRRYMPGFLQMKNTPTITNLKAGCLRWLSFRKIKKHSFDQNDFPWYALKLFHFFMQEEMAGMEEAYTQYENSQPRCEVGGYIVENN